MILFIVPPDLGSLSAETANDLVNFFQFGETGSDGVGLGGKRVVPRTATYVELVIDVDAYALNVKEATLKARVMKAYVDRYSPENVDFDESMTLQDAYNTTDPKEKRIDGLDRVFIRKFTISPYFARYVGLPTTGNGTVENIQVSDRVQRREWNIKMTSPTGLVGEFSVTQRRRGIVSSISANGISDGSAAFAPNELVGLRLRIDEQSSIESWTINGNTAQSVTVEGVSSPSGVSTLFTVGVSGDSYIIEQPQTQPGYVFKHLVSSPTAVGSTVVPLSSTEGVKAGTSLYVTNGVSSEVVTVNSVSEGVVQLSKPSGFAYTTNPSTRVSAVWKSDDGSVSFSVVPGTSQFFVGDELYVDTYENASDIDVRPECFPKLVASTKLNVNVIGGLK